MSNKMFANNKAMKSLLLARRIAITGYFGLLVFIPLWIFIAKPSENIPTWLLLLVWWLPLFFPLSGIIKNRIYTFSWAGFITLPYIGHGLTEMMASHHQLHLASGETLLALMMLLGSVFYVRGYKKIFNDQNP